MPERLLETPGIERIVPVLNPGVLHRVLAHSGLDDTLPLLSLATPVQLRAVLDLDLWRSTSPGVDESFDADRFGEWLESLADAGESVAADMLARMPPGLVISALSRVIRVFDQATLASPAEQEAQRAGRPGESLFTTDIGAYHVVAQTNAPWDAVVCALGGLRARHESFFHVVMRGCRHLSNSGFELDGLDNLLDPTSQAWLDESNERIERREHQGYVTPGDARAFLRAARERPVASGADATDPTWLAWRLGYFTSSEESQASSTPHSTDGEPPANDLGHESPTPPRSATGDARHESPAVGAAAEVLRARQNERDDAVAIATLLDLLAAEGVLPPAPRALLSAGDEEVTRLRAFHRTLRFVREWHPAVFEQRGHELTFLANVLLAGCRVRQRALTPGEASDAAMAVCNLGLTHWPGTWSAASADDGTAASTDALVGHTLVAAFQVGWHVLHTEVCLHAARCLVDSLRQFTISDRELQSGLKRLQREVSRHLKAGEPWRAANELDVLASIDTPSWIVLLGLIAEFPVIHPLLLAKPGERILSVDPQKFDYLSEPHHVSVVRHFLESLTERLTN